MQGSTFNKKYQVTNKLCKDKNKGKDNYKNNDNIINFQINKIKKIHHLI